MVRRSFVFGALLAVTLVAANGCQSCSSCHDYDSPVANCHCGGGGCSSCGCGGCSSCGCNSGCSSCGCNGGNSGCGCNGAVMQPTESTEGTPVMMQGTPQPMQQSNGSR